MIKRTTKFIFIIFIFILIVNHKTVLKRFYPVYYEEKVSKYSQKYDLDPYLIYSLIKVESKFNPSAKSNKGALGLMQITPSTGAYIAELIGDSDFKKEMLYNPEVNIKYGCFYLAKLFDDFNGNLDCVLAAYNGGEGNVRKWLKEGKDGFNLKIEELPFDETRKYIIKVKRNYKIYNYIYKVKAFYLFS